MTLIVVVAVVGVVVTTVLLTRNTAPHNEIPTSASASGVASGDDTGPVQIITEEPTCDAWAPITTNAHNAMTDDWVGRDPAAAAGTWSSDLRAQYQSVAQALRTAADATVPLARQTPHRVVREIYAQFIAYSRAYADSIPTYTATDNELLLAANSAAQAIMSICDATIHRSAQARATLATPMPPPNPLAPVDDPGSPTRLLTAPNAICQDWVNSTTRFEADIASRLTIDFNLTASQWTPEQKEIVDAALPIMSAVADRRADLGADSRNPVLQDLADVAAVYLRAYIAATPTYISADTDLYNVAISASGIISHGCRALGAG